MSRSTKKHRNRTITFVMLLSTICLFTLSCAGLQLTDNQEFAVTKLSRIAGITLGLEKPEDIDQAMVYIDYIKNIEDADLKELALTAGVEYVYKRYGKTSKVVIIVAEVVDILTVLVPEAAAGDIGKIDIKLLNLALDGFKQGLELAK